jgi:sortase (surface protein transpeptidase)
MAQAYLGSIKLPRATLPKALDLPTIDFKPPSALVPSHPPIIVPPSNREAPERVRETRKEETPSAPKLTIPVIDIQVPLPETAVVVTAVTTAVVAVATTSVTQSLFEPIKKKVQKQLQAKVNKWKQQQQQQEKKKKKASSEN